MTLRLTRFGKRFRRKALAQLLSNNLGGNLRQQLLDGAALRLDNLYYSAIPVRGAVTPSMTRATVKTIQNNDGYMVTLLAGELGFPGARRVYNQVSTKSADNTVGSTISANVTAATTTLTFTAANSAYWYKNSNGNAAVGRVYQCSADVSSTVDRTLCVRALATSGTNEDVQNIAVTSTTQRVKLKFTADIAGVVLFGIENRAAYATDTSTTGVITFTNVQIADITAETDQTTAREYVSVGVAASPAYHGSMVDGVRCFPTSLAGAPLTGMTTPLIELAATTKTFKSRDFSDAVWVKTAPTGASATQNALGADGGAATGWTLTDSSATQTQNVYQTSTVTAANWTDSYLIKKTTGAQSSYPVVWVATVIGTVAAACTIDTTNGTATIWSALTGYTIATSSARCTSWNSDYWLVELTYLGTAAAWYQIINPAATSNATQSTGAFDGAVQGSAVFFDSQRELGSKSTSRILNTSAVADATRNADQFSYSGALLGTLKSLATLDFKRESGFANGAYIVALSNGTANEIVQVQFDSSQTAVRFVGVDGGVSQWSTVASNAYTPGTLSSMAQSWAANDIKMAKDGVAQTPDTSATIPTVDRLEYGMGAGIAQLNGHPGIIYGWVPLRSQSELGAVTA